MRFGCLRGRETESGDGYEREQVAMFSRLGFLSKHRFYDQRTYEPLLYTGKLARQMQMCKTTYPCRVRIELSQENFYGFPCSTKGCVIGLIWFAKDTKDAD